MDLKTLNLKKSVYTLCCEDPAIITILTEAGFTDIARPGMLATADRFMTLPKGAAMKGIDMETLKEVFQKHGYCLQ